MSAPAEKQGPKARNILIPLVIVAVVLGLALMFFYEVIYIDWISFMAPSAGDARLEIFDISGRSVSVLINGAVNEGLNHVDWDGRDQAGNAQPSGVYFTRLTMNGEKSEGKMLMLR